MDFKTNFSATFESQEEQMEYNKKVQPLMARLQQIESAYNSTSDFKQKEKLMTQRSELISVIRQLPSEIKSKARERARKAREAEERKAEKAREKAEREAEKAREKAEREEEKAREKEKNIIIKGIKACLANKEQMNREDIKRIILDANQFEHVEYDEIEKKFLNDLYLQERNKVMNESQDANRSYLLKIAYLLGKTESRIDTEIKKELERLEREEILEKKLIKCNLITWSIILVLVVLQIIFLGWWTLLTGVATVVIALFIEGKITDKIKKEVFKNH